MGQIEDKIMSQFTEIDKGYRSNMKNLKNGALSMNVPIKKLLELYGLTEDHKMYKVNNFEFIGMSDPYPLENDQVIGFQGLPSPELAYPKKRLNWGESPYMIYLPRKEVLFKMMRAGVKVRDKTALWTYVKYRNDDGRHR